MTARPRPLIAVRLTGPADIVADEKQHLIQRFRAVFGPDATCRTSTRHADHVGERQVYLCVTPKGTTTMTTTPDRNPLRHNTIPPPDRQEEP